MGSQKLLVLCLLLAVSWPGNAESDEMTSTNLVNPGHDRLVMAVNEFGYKLSMEVMKQNRNSNVVISPAGIAGKVKLPDNPVNDSEVSPVLHPASSVELNTELDGTGLLAMTLLGSVGKTYDELADALGFSQDISTNRLHHEQLGELLKSLNVDPASNTLYADTIVADMNTRLREDYRKYLHRVYQGDAMSTDFGDGASAQQLINGWIKNHTSGKIEDFLKEPLPSHTKVVLLSALYFSGQWAKPFVSEHTRKMPFTTSEGVVTVDSMLNVGGFNYSFSVSEGVHMIAFPYNDNTTTMYVLKPSFPKKQNITDVLEHLDYSKIDSLIGEMRKTECVVRFPKMEIKSKANLQETLKELGIKSAFDPVKANFALMVDVNMVVNKTEQELITRINSGLDTKDWKEVVNSLPNPGVHVDSVLHDVKITIDEYGTEAVAASGGFLARTAQLFYVDSPFYMFIRNERTKLVTFSAVIFDPTATV